MDGRVSEELYKEEHELAYEQMRREREALRRQAEQQSSD
jgi:hypothetical protein